MPMKTKGRVVRGHIVTFDEQPCRTTGDDCLTEIENGAIAISDAGRISWLGDFSDLPLSEQIQLTIEATSLDQLHAKEKGEKALARKENLAELANAAREFDSD
ncbi:MAG: hypothetical protein JKY10_06255, partial [Cohaesibacteraceae bacterium]|nr:hypothetical protein [Cohaesibacteraceae bacterium]